MSISDLHYELDLQLLGAHLRIKERHTVVAVCITINVLCVTALILMSVYLNLDTAHSH